MNLNNLIILFIGFIPVLAKNIEFNRDYKADSLDEYYEDEAVLEDMSDVLDSIFNGLLGVPKKNDYKLRAFKPLQNPGFEPGDKGNSLEDDSEDSIFDDIADTVNSLFDDAVNIFKNNESEEKSVKSYLNSVAVKTPDINEVKRHWGHASFSYCIKEQKAYHLCKFSDCTGYNVTKTFENTKLKTFAIVGIDETKQEVIVSHRGTESSTNWLSNGKLLKTKMDNFDNEIEVHKGFYEVYKSNELEVNNYLFELLKNSRYKGYKVIFTGHSLGAAVTTIHAATVVNKLIENGNKVELYAYHSPRVGDKNFAQFVSGLNMTIARYTNKNDPVSRVPPRISDYHHILGEFHYPSKGDSVIICDTKFDEDPNCGIGESFKPNKEDHMYAFNINKSEFCI